MCDGVWQEVGVVSLVYTCIAYCIDCMYRSTRDVFLLSW